MVTSRRYLWLAAASGGIGLALMALPIMLWALYPSTPQVGAAAAWPMLFGMWLLLGAFRWLDRWYDTVSENSKLARPVDAEDDSPEAPTAGEKPTDPA